MKVEASFHQERLWFIDRFETGYVYETNPVYHNIPLLLEIKGDINIPLLEYGIREAARRHQPLRTRIETVDNRPVQVIETGTVIKLERLDLSNDPGQVALEAALTYAAKPMPLDGESLIRALLIRGAGQYYLLCVVVHHIICDRHSLSLLARETLDIYRAAAAGSTLALPEIPFHYADFSQWQRQMSADVSGPLLSYWKEKLWGGVEVLELPMNMPRPSIQVFHAARRYFEIPSTVFAEALRLAQQQKCTMVALLAAAFQALLHKYTGQEEIVMGTSAPNRDREGLDLVIGPIANLLVLRSFIRADFNFLTILSGMQKILDEAHRNVAMPFDRLVAEINPPKDMGRTVFFDVLFQYEESTLEFKDFPGDGIESVKVVETNLGWGKYDLNLLLRGTAGILVYNGDYFSASAVDRLVGHYNLLLERLIAASHRPTAEIAVLAEAELHQLLYEFNDTAVAVPYPRDKTVHRLFEEQASKTPDRIALIARETREKHERLSVLPLSHFCLTYCQLNEQSDRLAWLLKEKGVVAGDIVAIMMERSIELVVGVFGVLKAGCAYLPILPDYPRDSIDYILKDSGAKLLVDEKFFRGYREAIPRRVKPISGGSLRWDETNVRKHPFVNRLPVPRAKKNPPGNSNLTYIIYTSGSTGRSKGVLVEHASVVNLLFALFEAYPFSQKDCFLLKTTCMFDVSVSELFGWFLGGGRLAVLEPGGEKEPHKIVRMVENSLVTHIDFVPSVFNAFLDSLNPRDMDALTSLKYIFLAGEALLPGSVERFNRLSLGRSILLENLYGPTENTVYASKYSLSEWGGRGLVPIGKPLQNVKLYILGGYGHLQPVGIPGELCISGAGIAVGYLNRPELTAEKFFMLMNKNFSGGPGGRFFRKAPLVAYRTGDLARWLPDGNVEFLGRADYQIKIHGFRIEPGEIRHRLLELHYIKDCVIIDRPDASGDKYLCAYVVCSGDKASEKDLDIHEIKDHLSRKLPGYMIPAHFVRLDAIPLNPNGKIDRRALPAPEIKVSEGYLPPADETEKKIAALWAEALSIVPDVIGRDTNFFEIGGNSLRINQVASGVMEHFGIDMPGVVMFVYPTVASLSYHLTRMMGVGMPGPALEGAAAKLPGRALGGCNIAVIGMAGRFGGASNIDGFWENIKSGKECISHFSAEELTGAGMAAEIVGDPSYVKSYGVLKDKEYFDAAFFGFTPGDADLMDPQMRIFHECCWETLENAGYDPEKYEGLIGVYAGGGHNLDWEIQFRLSGKNDATGEWAVASLNNIDYLSTRIAYSLNLRGPAVTIQTACSTSLVAIHMACRALVNRECDLALAGGIEISLATKAGYFYQEGMINSPDGHCRAFDAEARGTVPGDGAGVTLLKPLADALAAGDTVHAVVKGSAVNNDGKLKVGFTAPGVNGQKTVIRAALLSAGVDPTTIGYVETHGTGTLLGDPIEIEALKQAFDTGKRGYCAIGSVKTNVGHTGTAAGAASFIKTVFMLENHLLPASLHFSAPNPAIDFENSPFYVNTRLKEWKCDKYPRRAGVSSFGIGGTNAHVVLEEYTKQLPEMLLSKKENTMAVQKGGGAAPQGALFEKTAPWTPTKTSYYLILLSAKTPSALEQQTQNLVEYFKKNPGVNLADASYTLQVGRRPFKYRRMAVCSDPTGATFSDGIAETRDRPVIFMFPGQGSQYVDMGIDLYKSEPVFRQEMDRCFEILKPLIGYDLKEILYPSFEEYKSNKSNRSHISNMIDQTEITQPVIFIIEYALAKLIMTWGIKPWAMIGHSIGEYTAAHLGGVFSLEDALKIATLRGKAMQQMPSGEMLGVPLPEKELSPLLTEFGELSLAAVNGPTDCVVSGPPETVNRFALQLLEKGYKSRPLHTSHAFHSQMMDPMLAKFEKIMKQVSLHKPRIPYLSNVTGCWITPEEAVNPAYWVAHARNTVRFHDGLTELLKKAQKAVLVEVGPGRVLSTFARRSPGKTADHSIITLLRHPEENIPDDRYLLSKIGGLWLNGQTIDWQAFHSGRKKRRISLPTYPFERQPYRIAGQPFSAIDAKTVTGKARLIKKHDITDWFYAPAWKEMPLPQSERHLFSTPTAWLVFGREDDFCKRVKTELEKQGRQVIMVYRGHSFMKKNKGEFILNPRQEENYENLFNELSALETLPRRILHLWQLTPVENRPLDNETVEEYLYTGFYSLLNIARALGKVNPGDRSQTQIDVIANHMQEVTGDELLCPAKAAILGLVKVIPQEYTHLRCRCIDMIFPDGQEEPMLSRLLTELAYETPDPSAVVAYRHRHRWVQGFEPIRLPEPPGPSPRLKEKGVYLVTGGLGGIGLTLAHFLAQTARARLVLTGRPGFPAPGEWNRWLESHPSDDKVSGRISKIRELEKYGAEVMAVGVDVSDMEQMKTLLEKTKERFGTINGVIHSAGVPDGRLIHLRTQEFTEKILAPKIKGTLALDYLLQQQPLDFFVLCSSVDAILGGIGQAGYTAANCFLDAFASYKTLSGSPSTLTVSINWDAWQQVGMAAETVGRVENRQTFVSHLNPGAHWVLGQHKVNGTPTLVGTAYLEMATAAFESMVGQAGEIEIKDLHYLTPLTAAGQPGEDEGREVRIVFKKEDNQWEFSIGSRGNPFEESWQEHACGKIAAVPPGAPCIHNICDIREQCRDAGRMALGRGHSAQSELVTVGERWNNLIEVSFNENQGLALLELPGEFAGDMETHRLHPALMDMATSFLIDRACPRQEYIPFSFKRVRIKGPLPRKVFSYARLVETGSAQKQALAFNIVITDDAGLELIDIEGMTVLAVTGNKNVAAQALAPKVSDPGDPLKDAILPHEGIEAFRRILAHDLPRVIISTVDFSLRREKEKDQKIPAERSFTGPAHPRPELSTHYAAPKTKTQQVLAAIWQEFLGIREIGVHDDIFELGADSLKALTVITRIHEKLNVEVSITEIFTSPTIARLAERIENAGKSRHVSITPVEKKEYYPLSSAQVRLYLLQQMYKENVFYNLPFVYVAEGALDGARLLSAFQALIRRHESLRTAFRPVGEYLVQQVYEQVEFNIEYGVIEPGALDIPRLMKNFVRPFDLNKAPLMRAAVLRQEEEKYLWLLDIHHIIIDAAGYAILQKELMKLYNNEELPPLEVHYKDFCAWQGHSDQVGKIEEHSRYWLNLFSGGDIPVLNMPTDYPRPGKLQFKGDRFYFKLAVGETQAFKESVSQAGATLFAGLLTILNVLLFKYTGQRDIIIGTPVAGRSHADLQDMVGMFVNMLPLRNHQNPGISYWELLKQVKTSTLEAFEHQDVPLEMLVKQLNLGGNLSRNPLFDICLNVQNYEQPIFEIKGLKIIHYPYETPTAKFDLLLWANSIGDEIHFMLEYSTELFKSSSAKAFSNHFIEIIRLVIENKDTRLRDMRISHRLSTPESHVPQIDFEF